VAFAGQQIVLWERRQTELALAYTIGRDDSICCLALSPDGSLLATGSIHKNTLLLRRVEDGAVLRSLKAQHDEDLRGLLFSPDGSLLASSGGGVTCLWGLAP
jgi:WD40 repeat protein